MLVFTVPALASWLRDRSAHWPADGHRGLAALGRECDAFRERLVAGADEFERLEAQYDAATARHGRANGSPHARSREGVRDAIEGFFDATDEFLRVLQGLEAVMIYRRVVGLSLADSRPCGHCGSGGHPTSSG